MCYFLYLDCIILDLDFCSKSKDTFYKAYLYDIERFKIIFILIIIFKIHRRKKF